MSDNQQSSGSGSSGWFTVFMVLLAIAGVSLVFDIPVLSGLVHLIVGLTFGLAGAAIGVIVAVAAAIFGVIVAVIAVLVSLVATAGALALVALPILAIVAILIGIGFLAGRANRSS